MTPTTANQSPSMTYSDRRLPPAPGVSATCDDARRRLGAIESDALPALAQTRACLARVWSSDAPDAVALHSWAEESISVHPAGADRLGDVLASEEALMREAIALRELIASFEVYDAGGSAAMQGLLDSRDTDTVPAARGAALPCRAVPRAPMDERAYGIWLLEYLIAVQQELWRSRAHADAGHLEALRLEFDELEARVQRRAAAGPSVTSRARRDRFARTA